MSRLPPVGWRPEALRPRTLACGHLSSPGQDQTHTQCLECYRREQLHEVETAEAKFDLSVTLVGTPKQVAYARQIRVNKVTGLAQCIELGVATPAQMEKLDLFRTQCDAQWFIHNRMFRARPPGTETYTKTKEANDKAKGIETPKAKNKAKRLKNAEVGK